MTSPLVALFIRSLREDARARATYWARAALGIFILLVLGGVILSNQWSGAPGLAFFTSVIVLQLIALTFIGLSYFASAVAEEKEEQTLGLLRMTDLSPLSILLGKSTSRLCGALLLLVGQIPFTIFAITLGGVSLRQIVAVYCTLGAFMFLLCNVALLGSVLARRTAGAAAFTIFVLGVLCVAGTSFQAVDNALVKRGVHLALDRPADILWKTTPMARLEEILGTGFAGAPAGWQVASNLTLGVGAFLFAWMAFERFCDRLPDDAPAVWVAPQTGGAALPRPLAPSLRPLRPPRTWQDALLWKDFYFLCGGRVGFIVRVTAFIPVMLIYAWDVFFGWDPSTRGFGLALQPIFSFAFSIDIAVMASRIFRTELNDQTFATLAALPITMRQVAYRKALACLCAASPGAVATVVIQILALVHFPTMPAGPSGPVPMPSMQKMMAFQFVSGMVTWILMVYVIAWLSLWMKRGALPLGYVLTHAFGIIVTIACTAVIALLNFSSLRSIATGTTTVNTTTVNTTTVNMMTMFVEMGPVVTAVLSFGAIIFLHWRGLRRLEELAGES